MSQVTPGAGLMRAQPHRAVLFASRVCARWSVTRRHRESINGREAAGALEEAAGGATLWIIAWKGTAVEERLTVTLTAGEAEELVGELARVLEEAPA